LAFSGEPSASCIPDEKKFKMDQLGRNDRPRSHWGSFYTPRTDFLEKTRWPPNSPDINPVENLWSIMDEVVYKDPTVETMKDLKRRLRQAWKNTPLFTLYDLSQSLLQRLQNVIRNKGGHAGY